MFSAEIIVAPTSLNKVSITSSELLLIGPSLMPDCSYRVCHHQSCAEFRHWHQTDRFGYLGDAIQARSGHSLQRFSVFHNLKSIHSHVSPMSLLVIVLKSPSSWLRLWSCSLMQDRNGITYYKEVGHWRSTGCRMQIICDGIRIK